MSKSVRPYTPDEAEALGESHYGASPARVRATVEALEKAEAIIKDGFGGPFALVAELKARAEKAEAERDERVEQFRRAARIANELTLETQTPEEWTADLVRQVRQARAERDEARGDAEHWRSAANAVDVGSLRADLLRLRGEFAALGGNHNKMEAQRDEARALYRDAEERYANEVRSHDTTMAERDEARAEVARLQDLHTRCAAFDDQPGPACVTLKADAARLREALEHAEDLLRSALAVSGDYLTGERTVLETNWRALRDRLRGGLETCRAALAGTP